MTPDSTCFWLWSQSTGAVIVNNLGVGTMRSPAESTLWVRPFASFYLAVRPLLFTDNVAAGSDDSGIVIVPDFCGSSPRILRNEVHSSMVGFFILPVGATCVEMRYLTAWQCSHIGVLTVDQLANLELYNVVVADNHIGISLNFARGGYGYGLVANSLVMGSTPASASCAASTMCRAMVKGDVSGLGCHSVYGSGWRRVGIMSSQYLSLGKTCLVSGMFAQCNPITTPVRLCSLPWEKRYALPNIIDDADLVRRWVLACDFFACGEGPGSLGGCSSRSSCSLSRCRCVACALSLFATRRLRFSTRRSAGKQVPRWRSTPARLTSSHPCPSPASGTTP